MINDGFDALLTHFTGTANPTGAAAVDGNLAIRSDTGNVILRVSGTYLTIGKNAANLGMLRIDGTNAMTAPLDFDGQSLILDADQDTRLITSVDDTLTWRINGVDGHVWTAALTVFNETGLDQDFRIEGDTQANLFFVDAGLDSIHIRGNAPKTTLDVEGGISLLHSAKTGNYTITAHDALLTGDATGGAFAFTLPAATQAGQIVFVKRINSGGNAVTVQRAGSDTIEGANSKSLDTQYASITLEADGTSTWYIIATTGTVT